ncbi:alpha/beta hydrolase [Deinococcus hopiensis]|uniref:Xaa-Pro dipeptidyl-peptidase-like domain-containing protein n=1 Tax=Deinococcus hopiensis KR-140 TaxID=695939 RepID=A0A1W1U9G5_9DEIO|nr:alpha/beta hydrolase [Deinococcus hopiensis]SMB77719.1 hypothetical protein SAMN00790413_03876 [Deinococcus hopiensis KR-140]
MPLHEDGYTFILNETVSCTPVGYTNRYGIELAGDLYTPINLDETRTYPALVIGPPHGGVKEQGPGVYANELARRGFVVLAFDPSYTGESGGEPRRVTSPEIFAEDFSAGVDYLGTLPYVSREQIGAIGICGSGGFVLSQASIDPRIRAVATSAMYDISGMHREGWNDEGTAAQRQSALQNAAEQRWKDVDTGEAQLQPQFPLEMPASGLDPITHEFFEYYVKSNNRGWHPRSTGAFTLTSVPAHINFGQLKNLQDLAPRRVLLITGEMAHSKWFSDKVHTQLPDDSELVVVPGARHIDLYDDIGKIPFDRLEAFFKENLA